MSKAKWLKFLSCVLTFFVVGCTSSPRHRLLDISSGMPMEQVLDILGEPVRVSYKEPYEAWLYEFKYVDRSRPKRSPSERVFC